MKRILTTVLTIVLSFAVCVSFSMPASAASKKVVYVLKTVKVTKVNEDEDGLFTYSFKYNKNGLLKSAKVKNDDGADYRISCKPTYNKKSLISSMKGSLQTTKKSTFKNKYKYNKKGYLSKVKIYNNKGKKTGSYKYTWTKKGKIKTEAWYSKKGSLIWKNVYSYDASDNLTGIVRYDGVYKDSVTAVKSSGATDVLTTSSESGKLISESVNTYYTSGKKSGKIKSAVIYRGVEDDWEPGKIVKEKYQTLTFKYKKVKTKKHKLVNKQQTRIIQYLYNYDQRVQFQMEDYFFPSVNR